MKESELNTIIKNNLLNNGWGYKIRDPSKDNIIGNKGGKTIFNFRPNPFDGFGLTKDFIIYFETKLLKGYQSFSFSKIQNHQIENLKKIAETIKGSYLENFVHPVFICGVYLERKGVDLFFFDFWEIFFRMRELNQKSVKKKELLEFKEKEMFLSIRKKVFDVNKIPEVMIYGKKI